MGPEIGIQDVLLNAFMLLPCQIIQTGRKLVYRLLVGTSMLSIFFPLLGVLRSWW